MSTPATKIFVIILTIAISSQIGFGQSVGRIRDPLSTIKNSFSRKQKAEQKLAETTPTTDERNSHRESQNSNSIEKEDVAVAASNAKSNFLNPKIEVAQIKAIASAEKTREEIIFVQSPVDSPAAVIPHQGNSNVEVEREFVIDSTLNSQTQMPGTVHEMHHDLFADPTAHYPKFGVPTGHLPVGSAGMFTFSSARNKRKPFGTSDFDAIPNAQCACDEWCNFCDCGKCGNDLGLDIYRRKPFHHKGNCEGCNDCAPLPRHRTNGINRSSLGPSQ